MTDALLVSRTKLDLPDLNLEDPDEGLMVIGTPLFTGQVIERTMVPSLPWLNREDLAEAREGNGTYSFLVQVTGTSMADWSTLEARIKRAFKQETFTVTWVVNGWPMTWDCLIGDVTPADSGTGAYDLTWLREFKQSYMITGPHQGQQS